MLTRIDEFLAATPAPRCQIDLALGAKRDGTLTAVDARVVFDAGLYPGSPVTNAMIYIGGLYRIPNFRLRGYDVVTNTIPQGAYRAPGAVQGVFAIESAMDELAQTLGRRPDRAPAQELHRRGRPDAARPAVGQDRAARVPGDAARAPGLEGSAEHARTRASGWRSAR